MNESSTSTNDDQFTMDKDHEPDSISESGNEGESDPDDSSESGITPKAELESDKEPRKRSWPPLKFPLPGDRWGPLHMLRTALKADAATQLRQSGLPSLFLPR